MIHLASRYAAGLFTFLVLLSCHAMAVEMEFRTWTSGANTLEARCVSDFRRDIEAADGFRKAKVTLETKDGRRIQVGFVQLSQQDRDWLMARFMGMKIKQPDQNSPVPGGKAKPSFKLITEKDVNDPVKLLHEYDHLAGGRAGNFESSRFMMSGLKLLKGADFSQSPPWAAMAATWINSSTGVMGMPEGKTLEQTVAEARKTEGAWWKPFKQPEMNEVLAFLAANNRTRTGLVSFQKVSCRTDIVPTPEELERVGQTFAYAQLEVTVHAEKKADEKIAVAFDALVDGKFEFIYRGVCYQGELEKIEREAAKRFDVRRSEGWCIKWLRVVQKAGPDVVPVLSQRLETDRAVILVGEKFGKMWTVCPDFINPEK